MIPRTTAAITAPRTRPALALFCFAAAACGAEAAPEAHLDAVPRLSLEREARIGDTDDPDTGFSSVAGLDIDHEGSIYVLEASVPEIRVYAPDGTLLRRIGRRGGGPGEFESPPRFGVTGDTVWTIDTRNNRITLFDRAGTLLSDAIAERVAVPLPTSIGYVTPLAMRRDGRFISHFGMIAASRDDPATGVRPTDRIPFPFVLYDPSGAVIDTLGWADRPPPRMWRPPSEDDLQPRLVEVGGGRRFAPNPPSTLPWWLTAADGYIVVDAPLPQGGDGVLTVSRIGFGGDTLFRRELHYRATRYTDAELDSVAARAARGAAGGMVAVAPAGGARPPVPDDWQRIAGVLRNAMHFPEFKVPIESVRLAQDESIWLRLREADGPTRRWLVLDSRGLPRGTLELPAGTSVLWSRGDVAWTAEPDEDGVPWIVRYSVRGE